MDVELDKGIELFLLISLFYYIINVIIIIIIIVIIIIIIIIVTGTIAVTNNLNLLFVGFKKAN